MSASQSQVPLGCGVAVTPALTSCEVQGLGHVQTRTCDAFKVCVLQVCSSEVGVVEVTPSEVATLHSGHRWHSASHSLTQVSTIDLYQCVSVTTHLHLFTYTGNIRIGNISTYTTCALIPPHPHHHPTQHTSRSVPASTASRRLQLLKEAHLQHARRMFKPFI